MPIAPEKLSDIGATLADRYAQVRRTTDRLAAPLTVEDCNIQTMADVSPTKWHMAHTSWFFETFILQPHAPGYRVFHEGFAYLFNSYYEAVGPRHARPQRGNLSRPTWDEVVAYRRHVDAAMQQVLSTVVPEMLHPLIELGLQHEQQHQELLLTDIKHVLGSNPLRPAYQAASVALAGAIPEMDWTHQPEGLVQVGHAGTGFAFDNESPRHKVWLDAYALARRPVVQGDWLEFMADGGYSTPSLWLSDGWAWVQQNQIQAPLYWQAADAGWSNYGLAGEGPVNPWQPVTHISFYEAAAYAQWAGARLPREQEWERVAAQMPVCGDFQDAGRYDPQPLGPEHPGHAADYFYGGVWEWTASSYAPYPGFVAPTGALGEYNAKFMASQMVLRGGSCATPRDHIRASYRNFFYPHQRWQFTGLRLARDD